MVITAIRSAALGLCAAIALAAGLLFLDFASPDGIDLIDLARVALVSISAFWLAWGSTVGLFGLFGRSRAAAPEEPRAPPRGRTVVLMPVCNEDPVAVFSRVAAMNASVIGLGLADRFDFAILSDTGSPAIARAELVWLRRLLAEPGAEGRIYYRRRTRNIGKKAGNIEDFVRTSGGAYDYAIILDADSLMEGATLAELARRMDAEPRLALLQTLPRIINAETLFGRVVQFSATYLSPVFARGIALMQGGEGPFWGHNAIVRISAFAASCGLPELSGKAPSGGHILSHDYVEAAMLARAGWTVRLEPDLEGSYEEGPDNLVEFAKRDRRWCQGNLQHRRLLGAPGLRFWNRFTLLQGIMAYLASPLWLMLLIASVAAAALPQRPFIDRRLIEIANQSALNLVAVVGLMLVLPKLAILARRSLGRDNRQFGGTVRTLVSAVIEIVLSSILAPILLLVQSRAVFEVMLGLDGGWPASRRSARWIDLADSWTHSWWIVAFGFTLLATTMAVAPHSVTWMLPAVVPMVLAPLLISLSALDARSGLLSWLFRAPQELAPTPVMLERARILTLWRSGPQVPSTGTPRARVTLNANA